MPEAESPIHGLDLVQQPSSAELRSLPDNQAWPRRLSDLWLDRVELFNFCTVSALLREIWRFPFRRTLWISRTSASPAHQDSSRS